MISLKRHRVHDFSSGITAAAWAVLRVVVAAVVGLALMMGVLFGAVLGAILLLLNLLGGRRARTVRFGWHGTARRSAFRNVTPRRSAAQNEVTDVEVREVGRH